MQRRSFLIVFAALGVVLVIGFLRPFATSLLFSAVFTVLLWPVFESYQRRLNAGPKMAAALAVITAHLTVLIPLALIIIFAIRQLSDITATDVISRVEIETHLIRLEALIHNTFGTDIDIIGLITEQWQRIAAESAKLVSAILSGMVFLLFEYIIAVVFAFYLLLKGRELVDLVVEISPLGRQVNRRILNRFGDTSRAVLWGTLVTITAQGATGTIGLVLGGVQHAVLWGVLMTFCSMIPVFGTALVWGPACFYTFMGGDGFSAGVILTFGLVASVIDNIIRPVIVGEATTVSTLWILVSILGGIITMGPAGVILGPALLAVFVECIDIYREEFLGYPRKQPRSGPRLRDVSVPDGRKPDLAGITPPEPAKPAPAGEPAAKVAQG
jgi:predicted PurR-regulated permease PerM